MRSLVIPLSWLGGVMSLATVCQASDLVLFSPEIKPPPIIVAEGASSEVKQAAKDLGDYLKRMSGTSPETIHGQPANIPPRAIWIGVQNSARGLFPDVPFSFNHPEEILIARRGDSIVIAGRDRAVEGVGVEYGTANAVYTFIERNLGVRWLWPGALGEDVPQVKTLTLPHSVHRSHPQIRQRKFRRRNLAGEKGAETEAWYRRQRLSLGSFNMQAGHAFVDWWDKYHEAHPDYFALQMDGTRRAYPRPDMVKLCVSNPRVGEQWLRNAGEVLQSEPARTTVSASPNDGSVVGDCVCEVCRSWDAPDGPSVELLGTNGKFKAVALTDRYVKSWNLLARGLQERFPQRTLFVGVYAYGPYMTAPVRESLERNIAVGFVGHFPLIKEETRAKQKLEWKSWSEKAAALTYRPNLFWYTGGPLGLPVIALKRTGEDFRFLAENKCIGFDVDLVSEHWSTQGVQIYLMAQLGYDPFQDPDQVIGDYYERGFGKAAREIAQYFAVMEEVQSRIVEEAPASAGAAKQSVEIFRRLYSAEVLSTSEEWLRKAAEKVSDGPDLYRRRVAFVRKGFDFTKELVTAMNAMAEVRSGKGTDGAALQRAQLSSAAWKKLLETDTGEGWPLNASLFNWFYKQRKLADELGPPSGKWEQSAPEAGKGDTPSKAVDVPI